MLTHSPSIVRDGLVLYLDAANPKSYPGSGTTWYDLVGSNNATLTGTTFSNNAINFDGTINSYGSVTHPITELSGQTWMVWCSAVAGSGSDGYAYILHINTVSLTGNSYMNIGLKPTNQLFAAMFGAYSTMDIGTTGSLSQHVFIALSWDGATQRAYLNGNLVDSQAAVTTRGYSTTMSFGAYSSGGSRPIQGKIGSIHSYNRSLTDIEIKQNFNALRGRYGI